MTTFASFHRLGAVAVLASLLGAAPAMAATYTLVAPLSGAIGSSFGSNPDADVSSRSGLAGFGDVTGTNDVFGWGTGYADMPSAFWGTSGSRAEFRIEATDPTKSVRLDSFLAGSYLRRAAQRSYVVFDLDWNELWREDDFVAPTQGNLAAMLEPGVQATGGLIFQWGESFNGGINNLTFTVGEGEGTTIIGGGDGSGAGGERPGVIPLPPAGLLLLSGMFGLAVMRRRA